MSFIHNCTECPMKFQSYADLHTHLIVHSDPTDHGFDINTQPEMAEFMQSFFPNLNPSDIPSLENPNSIPGLPSDTSEEPSTEEGDKKTYTSLANMHVPGMVVPSLDNLIKILPQPKKKKIRYLTPLRYAKNHQVPVIQPVYIERPARSVAFIQNTHGDDRSSRGHPEARVIPTITRVQRLDLSEQEKKAENLRNLVSVKLRKEICPPTTNKIQEPNIPTVQLGTSKTFPTTNFPCPLCHRQFAFSFQLNRHLMMMHSRGENPLEMTRRLGQCNGGKRRGRAGYSCAVCKRSFGRINYLNLHMRCHESKEQVGCEEPIVVPNTEVLEHDQI